MKTRKLFLIIFLLSVSLCGCPQESTLYLIKVNDKTYQAYSIFSDSQKIEYRFMGGFSDYHFYRVNNSNLDIISTICIDVYNKSKKVFIFSLGNISVSSKEYLYKQIDEYMVNDELLKLSDEKFSQIKIEPLERKRIIFNLYGVCKNIDTNGISSSIIPNEELVLEFSKDSINWNNYPSQKVIFIPKKSQIK